MEHRGESANLSRLAALSTLHGQLTRLLLLLTRDSALSPKLSGVDDSGTFLRHVLVELQDAVNRCERELEQKKIIFTGRSFVSTARVVNQLLQNGLLSSTKYDLKQVPAADVFRISHRESTANLRIDSLVLESALATVGLSPSTGTPSVGLILPEDENVEQYHIVQRVRFGKQLCVTVNFETRADMDTILNHSRVATLAKNQEVSNMLPALKLELNYN